MNMLSLELDAFEKDKIRKAAQQMAGQLVEQRIGSTLKVMFFDPHFDRYVTRPNHPDTGMMSKVINDAITEVALDPKWQAYVARQAEEVFKQKLDEAIARKAEHQARNVVFNNVKVGSSGL